MTSNDSPVAVSDATDLPAGALLYEVTLQPGETRTFGFLSPLAGDPSQAGQGVAHLVGAVPIEPGGADPQLPVPVVSPAFDQPADLGARLIPHVNLCDISRGAKIEPGEVVSHLPRFVTKSVHVPVAKLAVTVRAPTFG